MGWLGYLIILFFFLIFVVVIPFAEYRSDRDIFITTILVGPFSTVIGAILCLMTICLFSIGPAKGWVESDEVSTKIEIYSIGLDDHVHGHFTLGCGTVDTKPVYYFYRKEYGGFVLDNVPAEGTIIKETNTVHPHVKFIGQKYTGETPWIKRAVFGDNEAFWNTRGGHKETNQGIIIYLPVGSIVQNYQIRL